VGIAVQYCLGRAVVSTRITTASKPSEVHTGSDWATMAPAGWVGVGGSSVYGPGGVVLALFSLVDDAYECPESS
jgi:hypothetical protein